MSTQSKPHLTPEQYLEIERKAEFKSEYYRGEMYAMSGARLAHMQVVANLMRHLGNQLQGRSCQPLSNDMRVCVKPTGLYTYPDVVVVCGEPQFVDNQFDTLLNPTVIIEVLSDSTEKYDRSTKFDLYRPLESLAEYLLIDSRRRHAERFLRQPDGTWNFSVKIEVADSIDLTSIDCHLSVADLYERVTFDSPSTLR